LFSAVVATARAVERIDVYSYEWDPHGVRIDKAIYSLTVHAVLLSSLLC